MEPDAKKFVTRLKSVVNLINRCISHCICIPDGYNLCPRCKGEPMISLNFDKNLVPLKRDDNNFLMYICGKCNGVGYVDWISNASQHQEIEKDAPIFISFEISARPNFEAASWMIYTYFFADYLEKFDINFKFNNNHSNEMIDEFASYFLQYKNCRDRRKEFLEENFDELRKRFLESTRVCSVPPNKFECKICHLNPFDIDYQIHSDDIKLKVCGRCYGKGYQSKKETNIIGDYATVLDNLEYTDKNNILTTIIETADHLRDEFTLKPG